MAAKKRPNHGKSRASTRRPAPAPVSPAVPENERVRQPAPELVPLEGYLPPDGAVYPQVLRGPHFSAARSLLGVAAGLFLYLVLTSLVSQLVIGAGWAISGRTESFQAYSGRALRFELPVGMLAANLGIATLVPITWVLLIVLHRVRPRWLSSVNPGLRWPYLWLCLGVAAGSLVVIQGVSLLVSPPTVFTPQPGFLGFLVVIVLSSPLQAVAEEVFFRGYLMQALGSLVAQPWFGVIASSVLFALLHGTQNVPLFLNRLAFGLLAAVLVWRTGGLEAGIAAHVINNLAAYVLGGLTGTIAALRAIQGVTWVQSGVQLAGFVVFAVLAYLVARRTDLRVTVDLSKPH